MTFVHSDTESEPAMVLVSATKGGKSYIKISAPLFMHDTAVTDGKKRELSKRAQEIYDTLKF